jgi:hypothetical protein
MATDIQGFISDCGGLASTVDVADFLDLSDEEVREWAAENEVAFVGGRYIFTAGDVEELRNDIDGDHDEDDDVEGDDDDEEDGDDGDADDEEE